MGREIKQTLQKFQSEDEERLAARAMWEADPKATYGQVAMYFGRSKSTICRWANSEQWSKLKPTDNGYAAHEAADQYRQKLADAGPDLTPGAKQKIADTAVEMVGTEMRAAILARHRTEWQAPRKIAYEAVKTNNFDKAKLAKITAETLGIIQANERKAWGLDVKKPGTPDDPDDPKTIVIERE